MEAARVRELRRAVNDVADETLGPEDLMPRLRIDGDLAFRGITGRRAAGMASLAPFGAGNPRPVFAARGVEIVDGPRKLKERHLKMALQQEGRIFRAVAWRAAERHDYLDRAQGGARRRLLAGAESVQWRDLRRAERSRTSRDLRMLRIGGLRIRIVDRFRSSDPANPAHSAILNPMRPVTMRWRQRARLVIAVAAVVFAIAVALALQRRSPPPAIDASRRGPTPRPSSRAPAA